MPLVLSSVYARTPLFKLTFPYHLEKSAVVSPDRKATLSVIRNLFPEEQKNVLLEKNHLPDLMIVAGWAMHRG